MRRQCLGCNSLGSLVFLELPLCQEPPSPHDELAMNPVGPDPEGEEFEEAGTIGSSGCAF